MTTIYAAGYINSDVIAECRAWRTLCKSMRPQYTWLDPVDEREISTLAAGGLVSKVPSSVIFARDLRSVRSCDMVVANLNTFGQSRPPLGTISEIAWAFILGKPCFIYSDPSPLLSHPFLIKQSCFMGDNWDELLRHVDYVAAGA